MDRHFERDDERLEIIAQSAGQPLLLPELIGHLTVG
jgi:hypothetical protein